MAAVDSIGKSSQNTSSASKSGFSALTSEEFTKIIFTELSNQDPLAPSDTNALLQQLANIRNIQSDIDLSDNLKRLVGENQLSSASNLIGKFVSGVSVSNDRVADYVLSISKTSDGVILNLANGSRVNMTNLDEVIDPSVFKDDTSTGQKAAAGGKA